MAATPHWWQSAAGYQIYPRSFQDSNGDGIGDIPGILSRLDHLADLGIGFVWLSPVYRSPMVDNGYDIADYRDIAPEFGTLADMDRLIAEARARGIGIVMDLVVNHSSDRHAWFEAARTSREAPEHDYYIWRDPAPDGGPPSELQACFGGPAWTFAPEVGRYYLGFFSPAQPDLNWQNPALRREIYDMMNWWFDRGIAGFRMDVISLIGKDVDAGLFEEGPDLHPFLQEMHRETFAGRDVVTIGESWSVSPETAPLYCGRDRGELDMVFQFNHVVQGWDPVHGKWKPRPFDLPRMKRVLNDWQAALAEDGWNSLFLSNHDLPRHVSVYGDDGAHRVASAKAWATALHLMRGTPFVYQGEEIGMTNRRFADLSEFRDLETLNHHAAETARGVSEDDFLAGANITSRDHARTPMQWSAAPGAGFTAGTPWIGLNPNHEWINVAADRADPDGVFERYRRLIALRRDHPIFVTGHHTPLAEDHPAVLAYLREDARQTALVVANLTSAPAVLDLPEELAGTYSDLIQGGAVTLDRLVSLEPWEARALLRES
ncbi:glycoside hydrolase family 13 protein [Roseivivax sediminis]|uniref:Oligo-1,6-glucosidase n=1 Tax=Roseivivax sediminis TaxID=936889 RepID=A0A1I1VZK1_9RHOB|nr:alpha-glucosidase [Roseivivax sediminis]SFD88397.1 oligo-1,6-glucosidase [Roseivivax sediminis]